MKLLLETIWPWRLTLARWASDECTPMDASEEGLEACANFRCSGG